MDITERKGSLHPFRQILLSKKTNIVMFTLLKLYFPINLRSFAENFYSLVLELC